MATKQQILQNVISSYRASLAADRAKDLRDFIAEAADTVENKPKYGVELDTATAVALANQANTKITAYNQAVTLPLIDVAQLQAALDSANPAE